MIEWRQRYPEVFPSKPLLTAQRASLEAATCLSLIRAIPGFSPPRSWVCSLPNELLVEIFFHMSLTELCLIIGSVSRRFFALSRSPPLCRSFDVQTVMATALLPEELCHASGSMALWQRRRNQCQGGLNRPSLDPVYWLGWLLRRCSPERRGHLRELRVTACDIPQVILHNVMTLCGAQLLSLDLSHCHAVDDFMLQECLARCPRLSALTLNFCPRLTNEGLAEALRKVKSHQLRALSLCGMRQVTDHVLREAILAHSHTLTSLNLRTTSVSAAAFQDLPVVRSLRQLGLSCCGNLTDDAMLRIGETFRNLEDISVDSSEGVSDKGVLGLCAGGALSCVQRVSLARCRKVGDSSVLPLITAFRHTLLSLHLDDTKVSCRCLATLLEMKGLVEVSLVGCKYVKAGLAQTSLRRMIHQHGRLYLFKKPTRLYLEI